VRELINHFERRLDYKLEKVTESNEDSEEEGFPQNIRMRKETVTERKISPEGHEMNTISMVEYKERKEQEEFSKRMNYALRPREQDQEYQTWTEEQRAETEKKREEKLQKRKNKMLEKLEEAKDHLWKIRDDPDFEKKSEEFIKEITKGLKQEAMLDFLKFLYTLQKDQKAKIPNDQDKVLAIAKELIDNVKFEEHHIFKEVDDHVSQIVSALDDERTEDYLKYREQIAHDRVDKYFEDKKKKDAEGQRVYTRPTSQTYHLIKECGGEASNYGKVYEAKKPCKLRKEYTEDTINSSVQPKGIGFIPGKEGYHDEDCLIWVSHKERILKQICFTCEQERANKEEAKRAKEQAEREEKLYTDDISRLLQAIARTSEDQRSTGSRTQYKEKA
jgi:hypothetical protein